MLNKRKNLTQKSFLLSLYIIILGILAPVSYWIINADSFSSLGKKDEYPIQKRFSSGDKILVAAHSNPAKQAAVEAFADGDYVTALKQFQASLLSDRNDPEARIYLNNTLAAKTKDPYEIAVSVPVGGDLDVAQEILRGVAQAQDKINHRGGINGKLMMVEIANDDNDPEIAKEIADKLVADKKILAVVGHNGSNASIAAAPIYQEGDMVMITPTSSAETLSNLGDYIFRASPSTRDLTEPLADYAVNTLGKTNIAVCSDSEAEASISFKENFTWSVYNYGGKITPLDCNFAAPDFQATAIPSQAISQGSDALLLVPSVRQVDKAMEIVAANDDRVILLGNHSMNTYKTLKEGKSDVNGMVLTVPWYPTKSINSFSKDAKKLWGGAVNWRTAMAYDATESISKAISSGSKREEVQQTLADPAFTAPGATDPVSFLPSGDRNLRGTLIKVQPGKKSGTGYDFAALDQKLITPLLNKP